MDIHGKTVLVTGAAGALGSTICECMSQSSATQIFALDINEEALHAVDHPGIIPIACDLTDPAQVTRSIKDLPAIDILINNAGILYSAPLVNVMNKDESRFAEAAVAWQNVLATNLSSAFYVTQYVADAMVRHRTKGVIINISSISAQGTAGQSAYAATKAALEALTRVWAKELGPLGIRSCAVAPGYIDTVSTRKALPENQIEAIAARIPLKKLGNTGHILQAIKSVIENDYFTGTVLEINGGLVV